MSRTFGTDYQERTRRRRRSSISLRLDPGTCPPPAGGKDADSRTIPAVSPPLSTSSLRSPVTRRRGVRRVPPRLQIAGAVAAAFETHAPVRRPCAGSRSPVCQKARGTGGVVRLSPLVCLVELITPTRVVSCTAVSYRRRAHFCTWLPPRWWYSPGRKYLQRSACNSSAADPASSRPPRLSAASAAKRSC